VYVCTADVRYRVGTYTPALFVSIASVNMVNMGQVSRPEPIILMEVC